MDKKPIITIGIPAYNEEQNIKFLIKSLFNQEIKRAKLKEIIVVSDGSTDNTTAMLKSIRDKRIKVFTHKERQGINKTLNEIIHNCRSKILILLNADVLPADNTFIEQLIRPILLDHKVGLVGARTESASPSTLFEKIIANSHLLKNSIYTKINNGNNLYLCHGQARAFSKEFYSKLNFPNDVSEDPYSHLTCLTQGFKFRYVPKARVIFRSPLTLNDHVKQSRRFLEGKRLLENYFPSQFIKEQYHIPISLLLKTTLKYVFITPFLVISYLLIFAYIKFFTTKLKIDPARWEISPTTKRVI